MPKQLKHMIGLLLFVFFAAKEVAPAICHFMFEEKISLIVNSASSEPEEENSRATGEVFAETELYHAHSYITGLKYPVQDINGLSHYRMNQGIPGKGYASVITPPPDGKPFLIS